MILFSHVHNVHTERHFELIYLLAHEKDQKRIYKPAMRCEPTAINAQVPLCLLVEVLLLLFLTICWRNNSFVSCSMIWKKRSFKNMLDGWVWHHHSSWCLKQNAHIKLVSIVANNSLRKVKLHREFAVLVKLYHFSSWYDIMHFWPLT